MKKFIKLITLGLFLGGSGIGKAQVYRTMSPKSVDSLLKADTGVIVVDVRTTEEFESKTGHLLHAKLIPVQELGRRLSELDQYKQRTIVTYCLAGMRSAKASKLLSQNGFTVINLQGGINAWNALKLPTEKGRTK